MREYEEKMRGQQKKIEEYQNKQNSSNNSSASGDQSLVEQVASIVMVRVQADIEMKIQGCLTREEFDKYKDQKELFESSIQISLNGN